MPRGHGSISSPSSSIGGVIPWFTLGAAAEKSVSAGRSSTSDAGKRRARLRPPRNSDMRQRRNLRSRPLIARQPVRYPRSSRPRRHQRAGRGRGGVPRASQHEQFCYFEALAQVELCPSMAFPPPPDAPTRPATPRGTRGLGRALRVTTVGTRPGAPPRSRTPRAGPRGPPGPSAAHSAWKKKGDQGN